MNLKKERLTNHSVAPYNFVSLPTKSIAPYKFIEEVPKHNALCNDLLNGYIDFEIIAKTPLLIAKQKDAKGDAKFFTNAKDEKVIPGNTLRGMLRNNAAILSMSNISDDIADNRFFFRSFNTTSTQKDYKDRLQIKVIKENRISYSIAETIEAGYIYKRGAKDYVIVPGKKLNGEQYFRIGEQYLRKINSKVSINYMYTDKIIDLITRKEFFKKNDKDKKYFLKNIVNRRYTPYCTEVSFDLKDKRTLKNIDKRNALKYNGHLISSNYLYGKLAHYVISEPDFDSMDLLELNEENGLIKYVEFYEDDCLRTKKVKNENEENFFTLPKKVGVEHGKPIFYGKFNGNIYLGFTPYFRIPYDKSIKEGISDLYLNNDGISYCDALFGFTNKKVNKGEEVSYKGRISVEDAKYEGQIPLNSNIKEEKSYKVILGEPHATCFTTYLQQDVGADAKTLKTYNSNDFRIGGIKQYWQKDYLEYIENAKNDNVLANLFPCKIGSKFKGRIHFNNVKEEELGLILWSLKVDEKATDNIGMGKPFGFGRIEIKNIDVKVEDLENKYSTMSMNFYKQIEREKFIDLYKNNFNNNFGVELKNQTGIKELITIKTTVVQTGKSNEVRHMELLSEVYNKRNQNEFILGLPLLSIMKQSDVINDKKINLSTDNKNKVKYKDNNNFNSKNNNSNNRYNKGKNKKEQDISNMTAMEIAMMKAQRK